MDSVPDSEVVIACHCETMPQMHLVKHDGTIGRELTSDITYVDPSCDGKTWERIESNSKDYVWGENCPVYTAFMRGTPQIQRPIGDEQLLNILQESYRILKPGGSAIFGEMSDFIKKDKIKEIADYPKIKPHWKVRIKKASKFPINLAHKSKVGGFYTTKEELIIFTKRAPAGGRRKSKMKCLKVTRNNKQKIPPYSAYQCPGKTRKGKDGWYTSTDGKDGVWRWAKN